MEKHLVLYKNIKKHLGIDINYFSGLCKKMMTENKSNLIAVSARIPLELHGKMLEIQEVLDWSSIQFISKSIEISLAQIINENEKELPDDLKVARFTYNLKRKKK